MNNNCLSAVLFAVISSFITKQVFAEQNVVFLLPSGVHVEIVESIFNSRTSKITGRGNNKNVCLINGHIPFGVDNCIPKTITKSIVVSHMGQSYSLDTTDMYNSWGNRPLEIKGTIRYFGGGCFNERNCQFRGIFSDAAGTFVAEWRIIDGLSIRTVLTNSGDVVNLFMRHIDPPEFD